MDASTQTTTRITRLNRLGTRRLSRAHLTLSSRPSGRDEAVAALVRVCAGLEETLAVPVKGQGRLLDSVFDLDRSVSSGCALALFELGALGERALLEVELPLLLSAVGRLSGSGGKPTAASALTRIEESVFGYLCLVAVAALRKDAALEARYAPRLVRVTTERASALADLEGKGGWLAAEVTFAVADVSGQARVYLPCWPLQAALAALPRPAVAAAAAEVLAARVSGRVLAGRSSLPLDTATQLSRGDVVTFEDLSVAGGCLVGPARILTSTFELTGAFGPEGFRVLRAANSALTQESSMTVPQLPAAEALPTLTVDVEVELTRLKLPLSELSMLRTGGLLALRCNATEPVILRVGDRAVARAELVEIEGELGARILQLLP